MPINIDDFLRHQLYLERLNSNIVNTAVYPSLDATYRAIREQLLLAENINTPVKLRRIVRLVNEEIDKNNGWKAVTESLEETALYESVFQAEFIAASTSVAIKKPARKQVQDFIDQALMTVTSGQRVQSALWPEFVEQNIASQKQLVDGLIRQGYSRGDTVNTIARRVRDAHNGILLREAETLARTGFSHYMSVAGQVMAQAQTIKMREFPIVTFDNRTTEICMSIAARYQEKGWPAGESPVGYPPYHYNERTRIIALPEGETLTGTRSAIGAKDTKEAREAFEARESRLRKASQVKYRGKKDTNIFTPGQISTKVPINNWLASQPDYFVIDTLGASRAKLFRAGMPLERFTDATNRKLTLDELRQRDADLFARAGL